MPGMTIRLFGASLLLPLALTSATAHARNYDCSKPGNANKAVCKTPVKPAAPAAAKPAPSVAASASRTASAPRNYDCTKLGNRFRKECRAKAASSSAAAQTTPVASAKPAVATAAAKPTAAGPQGATAKCKDGSYSHAAHHSGACSHHGGVAQFYN